MDDQTKVTDRKVPECGDDFENAIPSAPTSDESGSEIFGKNPWKVVLDSLLEEDSKQCDLWKDEVNTLLIFAGLFSAVVTAFIVESYKLLQVNADTQTMAVFNRMAERLDHLALLMGPNPPTTVTRIAPVVENVFTPAPHVIRINTLWFCSLVLALTTVVIGIVALQWIRNHQKYHEMTPREALSVYEMRTKALKSWHIRWAFLSLPLLILVALVLFFVGMVDFLLSLNHKVAAPVAVLVYITVAILFVTTIAPSLQILKLSILGPSGVKEASITKEQMPTPCPYKSPQSWLFHRFLIYSIKWSRRLVDFFVTKANANMTDATIPLYFAFYAEPSKWIEYDIKWMRLRDAYSQIYMEQPASSTNTPRAPQSLEHPRRPIFDEAQILLATVSKLPSPEVLFAAYHCFREVSLNATSEECNTKADEYAPKPPERNDILRGYYWKHLKPKGANLKGPSFKYPISDFILDKPNLHLLHEENMLVFLQMHSAHNLTVEASRLISAHLTELQSRIVSHIFTRTKQLANKPVTERDGVNPEQDNPDEMKSSGYEWLRMISQQYVDMITSTNKSPKLKIWSQFAPEHLSGNNVSVSLTTVERAITWYSAVLEVYLQRAKGKTHPRDWRNSVYGHRSVKYFLRVPASMLRYTGTIATPFDTFSLFEPSFAVIEEALQEIQLPAEKNAVRTNDVDDIYASSDYLFLCGCYFIEQLFHPYTPPPGVRKFGKSSQCRRMIDFIKTLRNYEDTRASKNSQSLENISRNWERFWKGSGLPRDPREQRFFTGGGPQNKPSYIPMDKIPQWLEDTEP